MILSKKPFDIDEELLRQIVDPSDLYGSLKILEQMIERTAILLDLSKAASFSPELDQVLAALTKVIIPRMVDWWSVWLSDQPGGGLRCATAFHKDPALNQILQRFAQEPAEPGEAVGQSFVMRTGKAELIQSIDVHRIDQKIGDVSAPLSPRRHALVTELGLTSYMAVPILSESREKLGVIAFGNTSSRRHLNEDDLNVGNQIASLVAQAIKNAHKYGIVLNKADRLSFERECREKFLYRQIHDIKTLMTAVLLMLELIHLNVRDPEKVAMLIEKAKDVILKGRTVLVYDEDEERAA
jgi:GAF domain-containing protein